MVKLKLKEQQLTNIVLYLLNISMNNKAKQVAYKNGVTTYKMLHQSLKTYKLGKTTCATFVAKCLIAALPSAHIKRLKNYGYDLQKITLPYDLLNCMTLYVSWYGGTVEWYGKYI